MRNILLELKKRGSAKKHVSMKNQVSTRERDIIASHRFFRRHVPTGRLNNIYLETYYVKGDSFIYVALFDLGGAAKKKRWMVLACQGQKGASHNSFLLIGKISSATMKDAPLNFKAACGTVESDGYREQKA